MADKIDMSLNDIIKNDDNRKPKNTKENNSPIKQIGNRKIQRKDEYKLNSKSGFKRQFRREERKNINNKYENTSGEENSFYGRLVKISNLHKAINNEDLRVSNYSKDRNYSLNMDK